MAEWRVHQRSKHRMKRRGRRMIAQMAVGGAHGSESDGMMVSAGVGVGCARRVIVTRDEISDFIWRRQSGPIAQQPQRRCEMSGMGPLGFRQASIDHAQSQPLDRSIIG